MIMINWLAKRAKNNKKKSFANLCYIISKIIKNAKKIIKKKLKKVYKV